MSYTESVLNITPGDIVVRSDKIERYEGLIHDKPYYTTLITREEIGNDELFQKIKNVVTGAFYNGYKKYNKSVYRSPVI